MKPKAGEFWIVEFRGKMTIGQPVAEGARWQFVGDMKGYDVDSDATFRAVRKIDIGALLDQPAPVAWRWRIAGDNRWTLLDYDPVDAMSPRAESEPLFRGHPPADLGPRLDRALEDNQRLRDEVERLRGTAQAQIAKDFVEQLKGVRRMLWLIVKTAGAPGGVTIDRADIEAFDPLKAELISSTDAAGNIHVAANMRGGE